MSINDVVRKFLAVDIQVDGRGQVPAYAHPGDAGCDLCAALDQPEKLWPGDIRAIPTGLRVAVPMGFEMQIRSRSGLSLRGIVVANAPGTIDAGFRGEVKVILRNSGKTEDGPFVIEPGMRIAQAVFAPVIQASFIVVDSQDETSRGDGGFGSTGV
jgi:dUTP pyrophosphatase